MDLLEGFEFCKEGVQRLEEFGGGGRVEVEDCREGEA